MPTSIAQPAAKPTVKLAKPRALLFDLDGTLIDTEELILTSLRHATAQVLPTVPPDDVLRDMIGIPLKRQMEKLDPEGAEEMLGLYREHNNQHHDDLIKGFPDVEEVLVKLAAAGYRLAVVTSKMTDQALRGLRVFNLEGHFEFVQGADKTTRHKPEPEPLLYAAEMLGLPPGDCAYIGDSPYDMESARAAGMLAVAALWGIFSCERLLAAGGQQTAATPRELLSLFV